MDSLNNLLGAAFADFEACILLGLVAEEDLQVFMDGWFAVERQRPRLRLVAPLDD